jgi:hypothetical protein
MRVAGSSGWRDRTERGNALGGDMERGNALRDIERGNALGGDMVRGRMEIDA